MSGFVGILHLDGAPVDRDLLGRLTQSLAFRGPDGNGTWCDGAVGLGHTLLRTTIKAKSETDRNLADDKQPTALGVRLWIVADARIDGRVELIEQLKAKSAGPRLLSLATPDALLILHAYDVWGEACVEHLIGDFSFAIWDAEHHKMFCARDQFGVKPFFYTNLGSIVIFSNTLECIRRHPAVSGNLNDLAIADFLLFDSQQEPGTTSFANIQRLPSAHLMTCAEGNMRVRRYWAPSVTEFLQYRSKEEYVDRFRELFDAAVADRLRTDTASVLMSGGLDSSIVAAAASRQLSRNGSPPGLRAYTDVFDSLIPHEERHYATLVAEALKIPIKYTVLDHCGLFEGAEKPENHSPEPSNSAWPNTSLDQLRQIAADDRVALSGYGGDPTLSGRISVHFRQLIETKQFGRALADGARYFLDEGRFSRLYLRKRWIITARSRRYAAQYPVWVNDELETRLGLRDRWEYVGRGVPPAAAARVEAHQAMVDPMWANLFEGYDAGVTRIPAEVRHPFFDLRLVNFLLALPRLPWCCDKQILREAMRGVLPEAIRLRPKSPLAADPLIVLLQRPESAWVDRFQPVAELERYVVRNRIPSVHKKKDWTASMHLRPQSLNFWLRMNNVVRYG